MVVLAVEWGGGGFSFLSEILVSMIAEFMFIEPDWIILP